MRGTCDRVYGLVTFYSYGGKTKRTRVNSELSDSDSEFESQPGPSKKSAKKRKMKYKSKFQRSGQRPGHSSLRYLEISIPFHVLYALGEYPVSTRECVT